MISFELSIASCKFTPHGERNGAQNAIYARQIFNDKLLPQGLLFHCECHRLPIIYPLSIHHHCTLRRSPDRTTLPYSWRCFWSQETAQKLEIWGSIYSEITESWNVICHRKNSRSQIPKHCADRDPSRIESGIYPEIPHLSGIHIWNLGSGSIKLILRRYNSNFELHALM